MGNRPVLLAVAGWIARSFGVCFYDLYYGQGDLWSLPEPAAPALEMRVRTATPEDLVQIIHRSGPEIEEQVDRNPAISSTCYVASHEDTIAGYPWVNREVIDLVGMHLAKPAPGASFVHTVFVFPKQGRKGIFQYLCLTACHGLKEAGFVSVALFVDKANRQSLEAFRQEGIRFRNAATLKLPGIKPICILGGLS